MSNYKADMTLNEKDSLQDMLNLEKNLVKAYAFAITEGASNGFRTLIKENFLDATHDQLDVFLQMTDHGYYKVTSASEQDLNEQKERFKSVKSQLS